MSLYEIKKELVKQNYSCLCFKIKDVNNIKNCCVTLMNVKERYHYVIIKKVENECIFIYDPLFLCTRRVKINKFIKKWSGICLFYKKI